LRVFELENDSIVLKTSHDFRGCDFVWYDNPVDHFDLEAIDHRVISFEQLKYYAEILFYLNPDIDFKIFQGIFRWIGNRESGKTIRTYSTARVDQMTEEVYKVRKDPYCRRMRRVVFNPEIIISFEEKMSITARLSKRGINYTEMDILRAIDQMSHSQLVINQEMIASHLTCSRRTINRLMTDQIKSKIQTENKRVKREKAISSAIEWIDVLSDSGNEVKMQELKSLTNIRDYTIIKEAIHRYEIGF